MDDPETPSSLSATLGRSVRIAAVLLAVILAGIALWAWFSSGNDTTLPFGYEGFD